MKPKSLTSDSYRQWAAQSEAHADARELAARHEGLDFTPNTHHDSKRGILPNKTILAPKTRYCYLSAKALGFSVGGPELSTDEWVELKKLRQE